MIPVSNQLQLRTLSASRVCLFPGGGGGLEYNKGGDARREEDQSGRGSRIFDP